MFVDYVISRIVQAMTHRNDNAHLYNADYPIHKQSITGLTEDLWLLLVDCTHSQYGRT